MKNILRIILVVVFIWFGLISYNHIIDHFEDVRYETEIVYTSSITNSFSGRALIIRNESLLEAVDDKIVNYFVEDGEKIASGDVIARVYDNDVNAQHTYKLNNIEDELELLSDVKVLKNNKNSTSEVLYNQIISNLGSFIDSAQTHTLNDFKNVKSALFVSLIKKNLVYGKIEGLDEKIDRLQNEAQKLKNETYDYKTIYADRDGYFSSKIDGYESDEILNLEESSYDDCLNLLKKSPKTTNKNYVGKIINDFDWYIILKTDKKNVEKLGGTYFVNINCNLPYVENIPATVIDIKEKNDKNIVVLKSNFMSKDIVNLRNSNVVLSTKSFYGLVVSLDAIRFKDGQRGVFVKENKEIKFKKIDSLFETEKKVISQLRPLDSDYLQAFDEVILRGQGLYDGKKLNN